MDYFETISTNAAEYEKKKTERLMIDEELELFSNGLSKYSSQKYGAPVRVKIEMRKVEAENPFSVAALASLQIGKPSAIPFLVIENSQRDSFQWCEMYINLSGFPIRTRFGDTENTIGTISGLRTFFASLPKEYRFMYQVENLAKKSLAKKAIEASLPINTIRQLSRIAVAKKAVKTPKRSKGS